MMDFESLSKLYELGTIERIASLKSGTVAQVWRMETSCGAFLVRTLAGKEQGELEWSIHQHLRAKGFDRCPTIFLTAEGAPCLAVDGSWYQVQRFLPGNMPSPAAPGMPAAIARTVKELVSALSDCPPVKMDDRFALAEAWQRGKEYWPLLNTEWTAERAEEMVSRCCGSAERDIQVIHGDLGLWNMIADGQGRISVIDFGEARMGDSYFDYASALGSVINHTPADRRMDVCREFLAELGADRARLLEQLRLWIWRGLAQWAILAGKGVPGVRMASRFINALKWAEENINEL